MKVMPQCHKLQYLSPLPSIDDVVEELLAAACFAAGLIPSLARRIRREWATVRILLLTTEHTTEPRNAVHGHTTSCLLVTEKYMELIASYRERPN